ncbi:MAG: PIN domain-containing protein, partial [Acidimicrobiales bacterium]
MSGDRTFVDTNVLVYAYDADAGDRHRAARGRLQVLWADESGAVSTQVLQEFYVTVTRKIGRPMSLRAAREVVTTYQAWPVHRPEVHDLLEASELQERHHLSFWDALIVVAARRSAASTLLTEDLQEGRRFGEVVVVSP